MAKFEPQAPYYILQPSPVTVRSDVIYIVSPLPCSAARGEAPLPRSAGVTSLAGYRREGPPLRPQE
eukprot:COSAG05_NODE_9268_length_635_cov_1.343284_1_plen_65_part_10